MKTELNQRLKVLSTQTDHNTEVGFLQAVGLMQDNMCEYFKNIHCDGPTLVPSHQCFFVLSKTKLKIVQKPKWLQKIDVKTDISKLTNIRLNVCHNICDEDGNLLIEGLQELCPMDINTRRIRAINSIPFPTDVEINVDYEKTLEFEKFTQELTKENLIDKVVVTTENIDYYGHTNNIEYVKFILSTIPSSEFYKMDVTGFEIHYINESREGEELDIYCRKTPTNYYFEIKNCESCICKAMLKYCQHVDR